MAFFSLMFCAPVLLTGVIWSALKKQPPPVSCADGGCLYEWFPRQIPLRRTGEDDAYDDYYDNDDVV